MPKALIIEDERSIADAILYTLETEGFVCRWAQSLAEARVLLAESPDLILLDVGLPDGNGFEFCREIRASGGSASSGAADVPVLFLTSRGSEIDRVVGLEIGGDDYVVKPFSPRELGARAKALLRRARRGGSVATAAANTPSIFSTSAAAENTGDRAPAKSTNDFESDSEDCSISYLGTRLDLTRYEYRLLKVLVEKPGRVFSREQLMRLAWDEPEASLERTVDAHVKSLRAKLRIVAPDADPIETRRGLGYVLRPAP